MLFGREVRGKEKQRVEILIRMRVAQKGVTQNSDRDCTPVPGNGMA